MKYPEFLKQSGTIGFCAPSFGCNIEPYRSAFDASLDMWRQKGYNVKLGPNCYAGDGIGISSTPKNCGNELTDSYTDEASDVLISCGGGELMCETLSYVDFERIGKSKPKWYMGYSDNTNFTFTLTTMCDVASIYGPCAAAFGMDPMHRSLLDSIDILTGKVNNRFSFSGYGMWERESLKDEDHPFVPLNLTEKTVLHRFIGDGDPLPKDPAMRKEPDSIMMQGRLLGGCLDCLVNLCGTKYDHVSQFIEKYKNEGILWFLESCDLNTMSIRRTMWELENAGWFDAAAGFIIGRPLHFDEPMMGLDQYMAVYDIVSKHKTPILMDADIGHLSPMVPIINGSYGYVKATGNDWTIEMELK